MTEQPAVAGIRWHHFMGRSNRPSGQPIGVNGRLSGLRPSGSSTAIARVAHNCHAATTFAWVGTSLATSAFARAGLNRTVLWQLRNLAFGSLLARSTSSKLCLGASAIGVPAFYGIVIRHENHSLAVRVKPST
jgi:hypothetical protein